MVLCKLTRDFRPVLSPSHVAEGSISEEGSRSALIVVAHVFSWPPVRLCHVWGGMGRSRPLMSSPSGRSYGRSPFSTTGGSLPCGCNLFNPFTGQLEPRPLRFFELVIHQLGYRLAFLVASGQHALTLRTRMVWYLQLKKGNRGAPTCLCSAYL